MIKLFYVQNIRFVLILFLSIVLFRFSISTSNLHKELLNAESTEHKIESRKLNIIGKDCVERKDECMAGSICCQQNLTSQPKCWACCQDNHCRGDNLVCW